jgi:hypothetical protein
LQAIGQEKTTADETKLDDPRGQPDQEPMDYFLQQEREWQQKAAEICERESHIEQHRIAALQKAEAEAKAVSANAERFVVP